MFDTDEGLGVKPDNEVLFDGNLKPPIGSVANVNPVENKGDAIVVIGGAVNITEEAADVEFNDAGGLGFAVKLTGN